MVVNAPSISLETLFGFTPEDIEANRKGLLSARQHTIIQRTAILGIKSSRVMVFIIVPLIMVAILSFDFLTSTGIQRYFGKDLLTTGAVVGAVLVVIGIVGASLLRSIGLFRKMKSDTVYAAIGPARIQRVVGKMGYRTYTRYDLCIGKVRFLSQNPSALQYIQEGHSYQVYYMVAPGTAILLSIE